MLRIIKENFSLCFKLLSVGVKGQDVRQKVKFAKTYSTPTGDPNLNLMGR